MLAGVPDRADLALHAADAEAAGDADAVDVLQRAAPPPQRVSQASEATQRTTTLARLANPPARSASHTDR